MRIKKAIVFLLLSGIVAINGDYVTVNYYSTPIKILPHDDAYKLGNAQKGDSFKILQKEGDWYHIQFNNLPGWVNSRYVVENTPQAVEEKDAGASALPEQNTTPRPVQDKPVPPSLKSPESAPQQNYAKKSMEPVQPKKASGKTQSKQVRDALAAPSPTIKKDTISANVKTSDTASVKKNTAFPPHSPEKSSSGEKKPGAPVPSMETIFVVFGAIIALLLIVFAMIRLKQPRKREIKNGPSHPGMDALIIAKSKITIFNSLTNSSVTIPDFLSEMGFKVHSYSDLSNAKTHLLHYVPDVVIVDWKLEPNIQKSIASILSGSTTTVNIAVIFYNIPNPASMPIETGANMHAHYLGMTLSDQDISRIVVPLFKFNKKEKRFKESVQATALEGAIQKGNLAEVLQFIEMGKKSGCLYVVVDSPFGLIYFEQGRILYAMSPSDKGSAAVIQMLDLDKGYFHFVMNKVAPNRNCNHSCLEIVAEWTRMHDEADRLQAAPVASKKNGKA